VNLSGFTGLLQGIGEAGTQVGQAKLDANAAKLKELMDSLKMQQGGLDIKETQERLRRLKAQPSTPEEEYQQKLQMFRRVFGREPQNEQEKGILAGLQLQPQQKITNEFEAWREAFKDRNNRYPTDVEIEDHHKKEQRPAAGTKPTKENTYDPSGHLRSAFVDPNTGEVVAWGPLVPEREAFHYITDEQQQVHAVRMPTMRTVIPGEIRQTEKAAAQWAQIAPPEHKPLPTTMKKSGGAAGNGKSDVIGHTATKYTPPLANALKSAQAGYTNWTKAMLDSQYHTPRTDLSIVFSAVRAQVQGAGRMTNTELDRELKAGSFGDRFQRWAKNASEGTLPDDQRQDLLNVIRDSWMASAQVARQAWESDMPDRKMPTYIMDDSDVSDLGPNGRAPAKGKP
jgi:hypothetical protein